MSDFLGVWPIIPEYERRVRDVSDKMLWTDLSPQEAFEMYPKGALVEGVAPITLPRNEMGEECPWPWDPPQLAGKPIGQYHCPYCGAMVMAGLPHLDYSNTNQ